MSLFKGKAPEDEDDLVITYRHVMSQNLGVYNPLRVIALCDSDAFYAGAEMVRLGHDPTLPLVVQQWNMLIAVNYPARKYGINRMDRVDAAKKKCPDLTVVHVATFKDGETEPGYHDNPNTKTHKARPSGLVATKSDMFLIGQVIYTTSRPSTIAEAYIHQSLDFYRRESNKILQVFKEMLPTAEIEKASIDEAFFNLTIPVREILLSRYPQLTNIPPEGLDTPLPPPPPISWDGNGTLIPITPVQAPIVDEGPPTEQHPMTETQRQDLEEPQQKESLQPEAHSSTEGLPAAQSQVVADGASSHSEEPTTWHDVALSIGSELMMRAREELRQRLNYSTSAGIARNKFLAKLAASNRKPNGQSILRNAAIPNYLDPMGFQKIRFLGGKLGAVIAEEYDVKTVGELKDIGLNEMQTKLGPESIWVYQVLRGVDYTEVKAKGAVNKSMLASKNLPEMVTSVSDPKAEHWLRVLAAELALRLNEARLEHPTLWPKTLALHSRQRGESSKSRQTPFQFQRDVTGDHISNLALKLWKDLVGTHKLSVTHISLAFSGVEAMGSGQRNIDSFLGPEIKSPTKRKTIDDENEFAEGPNVYICPRCRARIQPSSSSSSGMDYADSLAIARMEHEDFHLAQDLARDPDNRLPDPPAMERQPKKKKKPPPKGIEKYFGKRS